MALPLNRSLGILLAAVHLLGFLTTALWVSASTDGQAPLIWVLWAFVDLPWSLVYVLIAQPYTQWLDVLSYNHPLLAHYLYLPYILHGFIGTIWWFFLPTIIGGIIRGLRARGR
jgi:hypothetical protein